MLKSGEFHDDLEILVVKKGHLKPWLHCWI